VRKNSKGFVPIIILVLVVLALASYFGYKYFRSNNRPTSQSVMPSVSTNPTSSPKDSVSLYSNAKYNYQINSLEHFEQSYNNYVREEFLGGCLDIWSGRSGFEKTIEPATNVILGHLSDIISLGLGKNTSYQIGSIKYTEEKLSDKIIGGVPWTSVKETNDFEGHTLLGTYFLNRNNNLYLIISQEQGPCPGNLPADITAGQLLSTFKFTN
jgi:hypothetical protein